MSLARGAKHRVRHHAREHRDISQRGGRTCGGVGAGIPGISHQTSEIPGAAWRDQKEFSNFALIIIRAGGVCPDCDLSLGRGMRLRAR